MSAAQQTGHAAAGAASSVPAPWGVPARPGLILTLLFALTVSAFLATLSVGTVAVPLGEVARILTGAAGVQESWTRIVLEFRFPRALTALLGGAALGASGLLMQTIFRNPLAGPWVLGVSDGAVLGVTSYAVLLGAFASAPSGLALGGIPFIVSAMIGGALVLLLIGVVSRRVGSVTVLVAGLMIGSIAKGLVSFLFHFLQREQMLIVEAWADGTFAATRTDELVVLGPLVAGGLLLAAMAAKPLNGHLLGEWNATGLGVSVGRTRVHVLLTVTVLAGGLTAFTGPVAFLGVAVPHMARGILRTADHRILLPGVLLVGGALGILADLVVHLPWSRTILHLNSVTALLGAPVVLWAVLARTRREVA